MADRTDRLLSLLVILVALLVVAQTNLTPPGLAWDLTGLIVGAAAIVYAVVQFFYAL